jgi:DNA-binding PadR family transcriptional regulator
MVVDFKDCPCSGKNMSNLAAPWILLTLHRRDGLHGYELTKIVKGLMDELGIGLNITGLYRHLNQLEKRGMLVSEWDTRNKGPAKRNYYLTENGRKCLWRWIQTLSLQMSLIGTFFNHVKGVFPAAHLPKVDLSALQISKTRRTATTQEITP